VLDAEDMTDALNLTRV